MLRRYEAGKLGGWINFSGKKFMKSRRWRDGAFLKKEKERCFIVDLLGRTARGSRLNILFFGKIYEIPPLAGQSCYKKNESGLA